MAGSGALVLALLAHLATVAVSQDYRLPGNVIPKSYYLHFDTNISAFDESDLLSFVYHGSVVIEMEATQSGVTSLVLHSNGSLSITAASLRSPHGGNQDIGPGDFDPETQKLTFGLKDPLETNVTHVLDVKFRAIHDDNLDDFGSGFFWTTHGEARRWVLATRFELIEARTAFPCFDEPRYKAPFRVSVSLDRGAYDKGYRVVANTQLESLSVTQDSVVFTFHETPPLPTYLVAVLVSDLISTPPVPFNSSYPDLGLGQQKPFRTWFPSEYQDENGHLAAMHEATTKLIAAYTELLQVGLPSDKLDLVAVPGYLADSGNLGLIVFGDYNLWQIGFTVRDVVLTASHHVARQWLGCLVTPHWWSALWLSEGFAAYLEYHATATIEEFAPWDLVYDFVVHRKLKEAMWLDAIPDFEAMTHAVDVPAAYEWESSIQQAKASSVLRMWSHVLGVDTFYKAVRSFVRDHAEATATPESLLAAFDAVADESSSDLRNRTPSSLFRDWHLQPGYPVVKVQLMLRPNAYLMTQERFWYSEADRGPADELYPIPISFATSSDLAFDSTAASHWLLPDDALIVELPEPVDWIVVNNQATGYYRVNYERSMWAKLLYVLENQPEVIPELNRVQLADDYVAMPAATAADHMPYSLAMELSRTLRREESCSVWLAALHGFQRLQPLLAHNATVYPLFKKHLLFLMEDQLQRLQIHPRRGEPESHKCLRATLMPWACAFQHPLCAADPRASNLDPGVQETLRCSAIRRGDESTWNDTWETIGTVHGVRRKRVLAALGCSLDEKIILRYLQATIRDSRIQPYERSEAFLAIVQGNVENNEVAYKFLAENLPEILEKYRNTKQIEEMIMALSATLSSEQDLNALRTMEQDTEKICNRRRCHRPSPAVFRAARNIAATNKQWQMKRRDQLYSWLRDNY